MPKKSIAIDSDYEEVKRPFDDVMRQILQAKPKHRKAGKPKSLLKKKPKRGKK